jgi:arginine decarboxylase
MVHLKKYQVKMKKKHLIVGNRIPRTYFVTSGTGESDLATHAGSYDRALRKAGIENFNFVQYSSLIPPEARRVELPRDYHFGSVLEGIMAVSTVKRGERATAGLIVGWVFDETGKKIGGLVAEHNKNFEPDNARKHLEACLNEMFVDRYPEGYELKDVEILGVESFIPKKKYGTALVVLGFLDYYYPILEE